MAFELDAKGKYRKLTPSYQGSRYRNGRPKVNGDILRRMKQVTIEEAWGVLGGKGHHFQFDGDWLNLHPDRVIVCLLYTSPSPRDGLLSRMPSSA